MTRNIRLTRSSDECHLRRRMVYVFLTEANLTFSISKCLILLEAVWEQLLASICLSCLTTIQAAFTAALTRYVRKKCHHMVSAKL